MCVCVCVCVCARARACVPIFASKGIICRFISLYAINLFLNLSFIPLVYLSAFL